MTRIRTGGTGRRAPPFPAAPSRRFNAVLALSLALLAAAIVGVQLGRSAISEINPVHFRGVAARPRAVDPDPARPAPDAYASAFGWRDGDAARARDCGGDCDARRAREAMVSALGAPVPPRPASGPYWRDATPMGEPKPWPAGDTGERPLSVERYMHYPVEETADAKAPPGEDESARDE